MRVVATRSFVNTQFGNVELGRVLEVSDALGKHFIVHGLAKEIVRPSDEIQDKTDFSTPVSESQEPGSLSQAGQVLPKKTAKPSIAGGKKGRPRKGSSR